MAPRNRPPDRLPLQIRDHVEVVRACGDWNVGRLFRVVNNLSEEPAKFTVTHIGRLCGLSVSRVSEYMNDAHRVTAVGIVERVSDGLRIPGERFGLVPRPWENETDAKCTHENKTTLATSQPIEELRDGGSQGVSHESGMQPFSLREEIVMAAEESARFVRRARVAVTPEVLEQLDADVRWLATEYLRRPPYAVFRPLATLRHDVFEMIDRHPRPEYVTDLYRVAGQLSVLLAHASSDLGQPYAADSHARTAWLCADLVGDNTLRAFIRWVQSNVAYWRAEYRDAAELAKVGQRFAGDGSDLLRLASQEARAHAALGDRAEADRALAAATDTRERAAEGARPAGVFYFAPGKAAYYASEVRLSLGGEGNFRQAARDAEDALVLLQDVPEREHSAVLVAAARLDMVSAYLALNDLDAANTHVQAVLQLPSENRTIPIMGRVAKIDQALAGAAFESVTLARDLHEQIALFRAYPAARELPQSPVS